MKNGRLRNLNNVLDKEERGTRKKEGRGGRDEEEGGMRRKEGRGARSDEEQGVMRRKY